MTKREPRRLGLGVKIAVAAVFGVVVILGLAVAALYLDRRDLARQAALAWLQAQGAPADLQIDSFGPTGLTARLRIGPAARPDLTVERAQIGYTAASVFSGRGLQVTSIKLFKPVLAARFSGGRLTFGTLDGLIATVLKMPTVKPLPRVEIESGALDLATDYGPVRIDGGGLFESDKLSSMTLTLAAAALKSGDVQADLGTATLTARRSGDQLRVAVLAPILRAATAQGVVEGGQASVQAQLSYDALLNGLVRGRASADIAVGSAHARMASAKNLRLALQATDLNLNPASKTGAGGLHLRASAGEVVQAGARLTQVSAEGSGAIRADAKGLTLRGSGSAAGDGGWSGLGPPLKTDAPLLAAAKRGLQAFKWSLAGAEVSADHGKFAGRLSAPVKLTAATGATIQLSPAPRGYLLKVAGGGLPEATSAIRNIDIAGQGGSADVSLNLALSMAPLQDARLKIDGRLITDGASARYVLKTCADLAVRRVDLGQNAVEGLSGRLCPVAGPMLAFAPGRWSLAGRVEGAAALLPAVRGGMKDGAGSVRLEARGDRLSAEVAVDSLRVFDLQAPYRFLPLTLSGHASLANGLVAGAADVRGSKGPVLVHADLRHDLLKSRGGMTVSAPLTFAKGGLQPSDVSPLATALGEPVTGSAAFSGQVDWVGDRITSHGDLKATGLSFRSPAGQVSGLTGEVAFTSLLPTIEGATVGPIRIDRIAGVAPITDLTATAVLKNEILTIADAHGTVGGGDLRLSATAPLKDGEIVRGEVSLGGVQVHDILKASPFGDKVEMTAKLAGSLPFQVQSGRIRVAKSQVRAIGPGRLSISRAALNPGTSGAAASVQSDNLVTGFAYQAMENLAFTVLDGTVESRPDGRLGVLLHIVGRFDPPKPQELVLTLPDLLKGKFLNRTMPLPSNTAVNLTLDTTLNLDNLVKDYGNLYRQVGSPAVQPAAAMVGADTSESHQ